LILSGAPPPSRSRCPPTFPSHLPTTQFAKPEILRHSSGGNPIHCPTLRNAAFTIERRPFPVGGRLVVLTPDGNGDNRQCRLINMILQPCPIVAVCTTTHRR
jgi:hypothetical protein